MANEELTSDVLTNIVVPEYKDEIKDIIIWRRKWRKIANWAEASAQILLGMGTILAYSAGFFNTKYLSFASGCCSTLCVILLRYSKYANGESNERNKILNDLLKKIDIDEMPNIVPNEQYLE